MPNNELSIEAGLYWRACNEARTAANGEVPRDARLEVYELACFARYSDNATIRNGALKALQAYAQAKVKRESPARGAALRAARRAARRELLAIAALRAYRAS